MKNLKLLLTVIIFSISLGGLFACPGTDEPGEGPAENVGEHIDEAVEEAGDRLEELGDKIEDSVDYPDNEPEPGETHTD